MGNAQLQFFSGEARANVLGATADLLLSVDEAQSVSVGKFDKDFDPITASTNSTRIFWGTAWTSDTLLERERRLALQAEQRDGIRRLFYYTAEDVLPVVPAYAAYLQRVLSTHGRNHPMVRSQFFGEIIDAQAGMFNAARLGLMVAEGLTPDPSPNGSTHWERGDSTPNPTRLSGTLRSALGGLLPKSSPLRGQGGFGERRDAPVPSSPGSYAFLIDVAGMDEARINPLHSSDYRLSNPGRDATALSIVQIDLSSLATLQRPTYHVAARHRWVGENHLSVFGKIKALAETWHPQQIVIDATGVGEGLWAMLDRAFPARVIPVKFSQAEKSEVGWRFISIIETGRFRDHVHTDDVRLQYSRCVSEILPGPLHTLCWGVPDGTRGPDGELFHDDFILADALVAKLDALEWHISIKGFIVQPRDPLLDYDDYLTRCHKDEFANYFSRPDAH
jgi:hypothetical protein